MIPGGATTNPSPHASRLVGAGILAAFFFSGMASLIHEVAWTRLLRLVMGNTTYTITTVLCVFMGGLALGAYLGGRLVKRRNDPLRWFAILEGVIGLYCLFLPEIIEAAQPLYKSLYQTYHDHYLLSLIRFVLSCTLLAVPATLMGATLPILSRHFVHAGGPVGMPVAVLYAINSFGAVAGAATAGFVLIPSLGLRDSIVTGSCLNFVVFGVGYALYLTDKRNVKNKRGVTAPATDAPEASTQTRNGTGVEPLAYGPGVMRVLLIGYGLAGFASLVYEIAWTRVLSSMIGSSVYAFSMMLCAFILGLASGSLVFGRFVDRLRDPLRVLAYIQAGIGFAALLVVPLIGQLPYIATSAIARFSGSFARLQLVEFGIILMVMLVPTTLMGASFPLASRLYIRRGRSASQGVGTVYAANTIGTILGSFAGGFILIPLFQIQSTLLIAVFANILVACAFLRFGAAPENRQRTSPVILGLLAVFAVGALVIPPWDIARMSVGPFEQGRLLAKDGAGSARQRIDALASSAQILYHNEGIATTVTVKEYLFTDRPPTRTLYVNGKADASSAGDMPTQVLSAHLPLLLHPDPKDVLVIGLASGITLGSASTHDVDRLDCAEISPGVVEACKGFFTPYNYNVTEDPRVNIIETDGRNHVALTDQAYDIIISEPSNPWIAGIGDLFTQDFFRVARRRLNDGGLLLVWFEAYNNGFENFASVLKTFHTVFPEMRLFSSIEGSDYLLVGSKGALDVPFERLVRRMNQAGVKADLKRIGVETPADLLGHLVMGPEGALGFGADAPLCTDDNALLEFSSPRVMINQDPDQRSVQDLDPHRAPDFAFLKKPTPAGLLESYGLTLKLATQTQVDKTERRITDSLLSDAQRMMSENQPKEKLLELFREGAKSDPLNADLRQHVSQQLSIANHLLLEGESDQALQIAQDLVFIQPDNPRTLVFLGLVLHQRGDLHAALEPFSYSLKLNPFSHEVLLLVGRVNQELGRLALAIDAYTRALELNPESPNALTQLTWLRAAAPDADLRDADQANAYARRADAAARLKYARSLDDFGQALALTNQLPEALQVTTFAAQLVANLGETELGVQIAKHLDDYGNNIRPQPAAGTFNNNDELLFNRQQLTGQAQLEYAQTLDAVGAARAAAGKFDQAAGAAGQAIALIESPQPDYPLLPEIRARVELYESGKPYRLERVGTD